MRRLLVSSSLLASLACERGPSEVVISPPSEPQAPSCEAVEEFEALWTDARRAELDEALAELPGEWPRRLLELVDMRVDAAGPRWVSLRRGACRAEDHAAALCLDREAGRLEAMHAALLASPETLAAELWQPAETLFVDLERCAEPEPGAGPLEPARARELGGLPIWIAAARVEPALLEQASARLDALSDAPGDTPGDTPINPQEISLLRAELTLAGGQTPEQLAGDPEGDRLAVRRERARAELASRGQDPSAAIAAIERAIAIDRRLDAPLELAGDLHMLARLQAQTGHPELARTALSEAIALTTRVLGSESGHAAALQLELAELLAGEAKLDLAQDLLLQARDGFSAALGTDHPQTLETVRRTGRLFLAAGRPTDAHYAFLDLLEIAEQQHGPRHWQTAAAKLDLAEALRGMDEHFGARTLYLEALPILFQSLGAEDRRFVMLEIHLGRSMIALDALDEAEPHCTRGRALAHALPEGDPLIAEAELCVRELTTARKAQKKRRPKPD